MNIYNWPWYLFLFIAYLIIAIIYLVNYEKNKNYSVPKLKDKTENYADKKDLKGSDLTGIKLVAKYGKEYIGYIVLYLFIGICYLMLQLGHWDHAKHINV